MTEHSKPTTIKTTAFVTLVAFLVYAAPAAAGTSTTPL
jgi:hypothetical protein